MLFGLAGCVELCYHGVDLRHAQRGRISGSVNVSLASNLTCEMVMRGSIGGDVEENSKKRERRKRRRIKLRPRDGSSARIRVGRFHVRNRASLTNAASMTCLMTEARGLSKHYMWLAQWPAHNDYSSPEAGMSACRYFLAPYNQLPLPPTIDTRTCVAEAIIRQPAQSP